MPLVGVRCDSEIEEYHGEELSFEKCLACARKGNGVNDGHGPRWCHAPYALINGMAQNGAERKDAGLSATMILDPCARRIVLQQTNDYREFPSSYWARFRGTIGHLMMEQYDEGGEGIVQEVRFRKTITIDGEDFELTGKMDHVDTINKTIIDYKSIKSISAQPVNKGKCKPEHAQQVSIYRWLLDGGTNMDTNEVVHYDIERAGILYFDMKGVRKIRAPLMSLQDTEEFIITRVRPLVHYRKTGDLPDIWRDDNGKQHRWCDFCAVRDICDQRVREGQ